MAAPKKTTSKKPATSKAPVTKKTVTKKPVIKKEGTNKSATKKPVVKKAVSAKTTKSVPMQSFKRSTPEDSFFTFKLTQQTLYWLILSVIVLILGVWVVRLETEIQGIYDSIEANSALIDEVTSPRTQES